eukprot:PhM_4_TR12724/c1_g1_i1/m.33514
MCVLFFVVVSSRKTFGTPPPSRYFFVSFPLFFCPFLFLQLSYRAIVAKPKPLCGVHATTALQLRRSHVVEFVLLRDIAHDFKTRRKVLQNRQVLRELTEHTAQWCQRRVRVRQGADVRAVTSDDGPQPGEDLAVGLRLLQRRLRELFGAHAEEHDSVGLRDHGDGGLDGGEVRLVHDLAQGGGVGRTQSLEQHASHCDVTAADLRGGLQGHRLGGRRCLRWQVDARQCAAVDRRGLRRLLLLGRGGMVVLEVPLAVLVVVRLGLRRGADHHWELRRRCVDVDVVELRHGACEGDRHDGVLREKRRRREHAGDCNVTDVREARAL